jgi:hypothetical protein
MRTASKTPPARHNPPHSRKQEAQASSGFTGTLFTTSMSARRVSGDGLHITSSCVFVNYNVTPTVFPLVNAEQN